MVIRFNQKPYKISAVKLSDLAILLLFIAIQLSSLQWLSKTSNRVDTNTVANWILPLRGLHWAWRNVQGNEISQNIWCFTTYLRMQGDNRVLFSPFQFILKVSRELLGSITHYMNVRVKTDELANELCSCHMYMIVNYSRSSPLFPMTHNICIMYFNQCDFLRGQMLVVSASINTKKKF